MSMLTSTRQATNYVLCSNYKGSEVKLCKKDNEMLKCHLSKIKLFPLGDKSLDV